MAKLLTQVQGRQVLKQVMNQPVPSLSRFNVEPFKMQSVGVGANMLYKSEASLYRFSAMYNISIPVISGFPASSMKFGFSLRYVNYLARVFPWRFGLAVATTKAVLADIVAQKVIEKKEQLDYRRTALFFAFGAIYSGGVCNALYSVVYPRIFVSRIPQLNALKSLLTDNLLNTPFIFYPTFYVLRECFLEVDGSLKQAWTKYKNEIWEASKTGWKIWFPAHCITFGLVPVHMRLPFVSVVSFFFFTVVSLQQSTLANKRAEEQLTLEEGRY